MGKSTFKPKKNSFVLTSADNAILPASSTSSSTSPETGSPAQNKFVLDASYNDAVKKKDGGSASSPTESVSTSISLEGNPFRTGSLNGNPEIIQDKSNFLDRDIDLSQTFRLSTPVVGADQDKFSLKNLSIADREGHDLSNNQALRNNQRQLIKSDSDALKKYHEQRISELNDEITKINTERADAIPNTGDAAVDNALNASGSYTKLFDDQVAQKKQYKTDLKDAILQRTLSIELPKYDLTKVAPVDLGRKLISVADPEFDVRLREAESGSTTLPGMIKSDLERFGILTAKEYLQNNPNIPNREKALSYLNSYESDYDERNFEQTWSRVKDKLGSFFYRQGGFNSGGTFGYSRDALVNAVNDPELNLTPAEKKVAMNYGIPLEQKIYGTDIPGSGFFRSFKNAVERSSIGIGNTLLSAVGARTDADRAAELLNAETGGSRFANVGNNARGTAALANLNAIEKTRPLSPEEQKQKQDLQNYVDVRNWGSKFLDGVGDLTGQVGVMALLSTATGGIGRGLTAAGDLSAAGVTASTVGQALSNPSVGLFLSGYLNSYDNYKKQAVELIPNPEQSAARNSYAATMAAVEGLSERIFNEAKLVRSLTEGISPTVANITRRLSSGTISNQVARDEFQGALKSYLTKFGKGYLRATAQESTEEAVVDIAQGISDSVFGGKDFDAYKTGKQAVTTFLTTALYSPVVAGLAAHGNYRQQTAQNQLLRSSILDMAANPTEYLRSVEQLQLDGQITQQEANDKIKLINSARNYLQELPETRLVQQRVNENGEDQTIEAPRGFDAPEMTSYILHRMNEGIINEQLANSTDEVQKKQLERDLKRSQEIREGIYTGNIGVSPELQEVTENPEQAADLGILPAEQASDEQLIGTPFERTENGAIEQNPAIENTDENAEAAPIQERLPQDLSIDELRALQFANESDIGQRALDQLNTIDFEDTDNLRDNVADLLFITEKKTIPDNKLEQVLRGKSKLIGNEDFFSRDYLEKYILFSTKDFSNINTQQNESQEQISNSGENQGQRQSAEGSTGESNQEGNVIPPQEGAENVDTPITNEAPSSDVIEVSEAAPIVNDVQPGDKINFGGKEWNVIEDLGERVRISDPETNAVTSIPKQDALSRIINKAPENSVLPESETTQDSNINIDSQQNPNTESTVDEQVREINKRRKKELSPIEKELKALKKKLASIKQDINSGRKEGPIINSKEAQRILDFLTKKYAISGVLKQLPLGVYGQFVEPTTTIYISNRTQLDKNGNPTHIESDNIPRRTIYHEYLHPFVQILAGNNEALYNEIYNSALSENQNNRFVNIDLYPANQQKEELVVRYLDRLSDSDTPTSIFKRFMNWLGSFFHNQRVYNSSDLQQLDKNTTVSQLYDVFKNYGNLREDLTGVSADDAISSEVEELNKSIQSIEQLGLSEAMTTTMTAPMRERLDEIEKLKTKFDYDAEFIQNRIKELESKVDEINGRYDLEVSKLKSNSNATKSSKQQPEQKGSAEGSKSKRSRTIRGEQEQAEEPTEEQGSDSSDSLRSSEAQQEETITREAEQPLVGVNQEKNRETREELGLDDYERTRISDDEINQRADTEIKNGYDVKRLLARLKDGKSTPTTIEIAILRKYKAGLEAALENNPTKQVLADLRELVTSLDPATSEQGRAFRMLQYLQVRDNTLAGFFSEEQEASGREELTEEEIERIRNEWNEIDDVERKLNERIIALEAENARLKAEQELKKQKGEKTKKKSREEFQEGVKDAIASAREKLKQLRNSQNVTIVPYANELIAIAPDVIKVVRLVLQQGITELSDVVSNVHSQFKDIVPDLTERDVQDIIAGEYNQPSPPRSEIAAKLRDLRDQAALINKLEALENGEVPKNEKAKVKRIAEIESLKKQIKEHNTTRLEAYKSNVKRQIDELQEQLDQGNYRGKPGQPAIALDREANYLKDKLIQLRKERQARLLRLEYQKSSRIQKIKDGIANVLNVPRGIMASLDFSAPLRQAAIVTVNNPKVAGQAGLEMFKQAFSQKRFDRWFYDLQNTPRYRLMQESGLYVADPNDPRMTVREEQFMSNLAERIPLIGKLVKGSERAYVSYLNKMRVDLFNRYADAYEDEGFTFDANPTMFKGIASFLNNATGRGNLGLAETAAPILNTAFFSPRLIASRMNILGIGDLFSLGKGYYGKLPPAVRKTAIRNMLQFVAIGAATISLIALAKNAFSGDDDKEKAEIETDPRSSDFGKLKIGNTRWDVWAGFQQYIRLIAQLSKGESKSIASQAINPLTGEGKSRRDKQDVAISFVRGKLAPVPSFLWERFLSNGKNVLGEKRTWTESIRDRLLPLTISDTYSTMKENGVKALFTQGIPASFGVGVQNYLPKGYEEQDLKKPEYKFLYDKNITINAPNQGEMTDKQYESFLKERKGTFEEEWNNVLNYGAMINEAGNPTVNSNTAVSIKKADELTYDELTKLMKSINNKASRKAKKDLNIQEDGNRQEGSPN